MKNKLYTTCQFRIFKFYALFAIYFLPAVFLFLSANAQTAQWVKQGGTGGITNGVSSDANGNCYATGMVSNPAVFDNISIPCNAADIFLAKYDQGGTITTLKLAGGELLDQGNEIATDAAGNSYIAGYIQTNSIHPGVSFGNLSFNGHGDYDWFIAKYDVNGNVIWAKVEGSTAGDQANSVALDGNGNVYVTGFFSGTMTVNGITITSSGLFDVFIAKYDSNGTLAWLKRAGGSGSDNAYGITCDSNGDIAITGEFQNTASFDSNQVTALGLGDAFIAKYAASGTNSWVRRGGGNVSFVTDHGQSVATDALNNFYITGDFTGTATFDNLIATSNNVSYADMYVAKYNSNGIIQWLQHGGGVHADRGYTVAVDLAGNSFVSGFADSGPGVVFDTITLPPLGNEYIYLAKYNPAGSVLSVKQYAAGSGQDIHVLNNGCMFFGGGVSLNNNGNEFDNINLEFVDRPAFTGKFCEASPVCATPSGFSVTKITSTSAKINWSNATGAVSYLVQYRKTGVTKWKTKAAAGTSKKLINLTPSTSYDYHVASVCTGDTSAYSAIHNFTTAPLRTGEIIEIPAEMAIFPNPSHGSFTIHATGLEDHVIIEVIDVIGKIIYRNELFHTDGEIEQQVQLTGEITGMAFVRIINGQKLVTKAILLQ
ncbi:MAG: SBBP repeat-containing protein [Chitinophagales bacterium]